MFRTMLLAGLLLFAAAVGPARIDAQAQRQQVAQMQRVIQKTVASNYLLYLPPTYEESTAQWPLLLFLHGSGERGAELDSVKVHGPPKMIAEGRDFPFIVVSPQCPTGAWWSEDVLTALLDEITETHRVDEARVYVTGLSMGGYGTWRLAQAIPERLAAIVPICGGGDPGKAELISGIPTWVFHGGKDTSVELAESTQMVNALYAVGSDVRFTVYPEAGHVEAWVNAYADEALWTWLARQHRASASGE
jgi:predicted peptidase